MPITKVIATELESVAMMGVNAGKAHLFSRSHLYQNKSCPAKSCTHVHVKQG